MERPLAHLYRHFEDNDDLLRAVCQRGHEIFADYLARGLRGKGALERFRLTGEGYLDFALEHRAYYAVMFGGTIESLGLPKTGRRSRDPGEVTFQMLVDRVRECQAEGRLAGGDPVDAALIVWGHVHGMVSLQRALGPGAETSADGPPTLADPERFRALYRRTLDVLIRGLAPR